MGLGAAPRPGAAQGPHGEGGASHRSGCREDRGRRAEGEDRGWGCPHWLAVLFGGSGGGKRRWIPHPIHAVIKRYVEGSQGGNDEDPHRSHPFGRCRHCNGGFIRATCRGELLAVRPLYRDMHLFMSLPDGLQCLRKLRSILLRMPLLTLRQPPRLRPWAVSSAPEPRGISSTQKSRAR
jgi:hypothetical protein